MSSVVSNRVDFVPHANRVDFGPYAKIDDKCAVCFEQLKNEDVAIIECQHAYHPKCLGNWIKVKPACPTCQRDIEPGTVTIMKTDGTTVEPVAAPQPVAAPEPVPAPMLNRILTLVGEVTAITLMMVGCLAGLAVLITFFFALAHILPWTVPVLALATCIVSMYLVGKLPDARPHSL